MHVNKKIAVVGSGLVGTLLAIYLKKLGHEVHVLDRSKDIRTIDFSGRSINLAMSTRGWRALENIGIADQVHAIGIPMNKRAIHIANQELKYQPYGMNSESIFSISRGGLNKLLIDIAEKEGVHFHFETRIWDVELATATLFTGESEFGAWQALQYDMVFGADGAFSRIRHRMQRQNRFNYSQHFLNTGYKELHIPADANGSHQLDKNSFHIWPRGEFMLIALPNLDGSFTCTLFMPFEGAISFEQLTNVQQVATFFETYFPDTKNLIPNLTHDFFKNPTSSLVTMQCYPWVYQDKIALIGDAAHAIVPFYGQGMNAGFEDVTVLAELIAQHNGDWQTILETYQQARKPNADAIAELSYRNHTEMSTKTADESFLLQKKIEQHFAKKYPEKWLPLYDRVTFSHDSYLSALQIGDKQNYIMQQVLQIPNIDAIWDSEIVEQTIISLLEK
ncbi:FAD-dependent monooxygenase [Flavobacterium agricola]|uniref:Kynurenine 3-monooxygenase n=1 Tax=Flavobacterium agricola TaxID=2870839 RepID=A0ABY6M0J2_9FLAO|nr:NAD(P)/FAD-dependent oxidoreductase [Flavobacterium agricola]UYW00636.1 FAD-dependent monooxygenase [Flavobacterium agricola]